MFESYQRPPGRQATPGSPGASARGGPPGWPPQVPPPGAPGWGPRASSWLLDFCPADYRRHASFQRYPVLLAWLALRHIEGELAAMRGAYREVRVEMADHLDAEALAQVLNDLETEGVRLRAAARGASLILDALQGRHFVPRL
jgi:hypothetical protein